MLERFAYKPSSGEREFFPLIIQIKKMADSIDYFGLVLVWERWDRFKDFYSF